MKQLLSFCLNKWWVLPFISSIFIGMFIYRNNIVYLLSGILIISISLIYQLSNKKWIAGCFSSLLYLIFIALGLLWLIFLYKPGDIRSKYSDKYESKEGIENIIGIKLPNFVVSDAKGGVSNSFDFEFRVNIVIEFIEPLNDELFSDLDRICNLQIPQNPKQTSKYFYHGLESVERCWTKDGNSYKYSRNTDFGRRYLHSTDAYFYFDIEKGSKYAEICYGNY